MEGYLKKHLNVFKGWKQRYFILHEDILVYSEEKGGKLLGQMHLKVCSIQQSKDDVLLILINSGTKELKIKAKDINEKVKWINALQQAQDQIINQHSNVLEVMKQDTQLGPEFKKYFKDSRLEKVMQQQMAEVWTYQAQLDQKCKAIQTTYSLDQGLKTHLEDVVDLTAKIKEKVAETCRELEYENRQLYHLAKNIQTNSMRKQHSLGGQQQQIQQQQQQIYHSQPPQQHHQPPPQQEQFSDFDSLDLNNYESFLGDEDAYYHQHTNQDKILQELNQEDNTHQKPAENYSQFLEALKNNSIIKYKILAENPLFKSYPLSDNKTRDILPAKKDPNEKLNIFSLLKDAIGKDLTRFAVPVYLNEPLSMLQRLCEQFEYGDLLEKSGECEDSALRLAYVMGFGLSITASTIGRIKKPFNPLLGETYEMVTPGGLHFISEQVSHHPPISAGYAKGRGYEYWGSNNIKTSFWGKSMEIKPQGSTNVRLTRTNEHITYTKNKTMVHNIIIGKTYIDHCGEMIFINHQTQDTGVLSLKQRGWRDRGAFEVEGEIKDQNGKLKLRLQGRWDDQLVAIDPNNNHQTLIWKRNALAPNSEDYYHFTQFTKQLNHLTTQMALQIPITDSRLRPDQKALEAQSLQIASSEKLRLEEKQRARRKEYAKFGKTHTPVWFKEEVNPYTKEKDYVYKGGYFECRQNQNWPKEVLDIF